MGVLDFNPNLNRLFRSGSRAKRLSEIRPRNYLSFQLEKRQPEICLRWLGNCKTGSEDLRDVWRVKTNYTFCKKLNFLDLILCAAKLIELIAKQLIVEEFCSVNRPALKALFACMK